MMMPARTDSPHRRRNPLRVVQTADGPRKIAFVRPNDLGVADHYVTVKPGQEVFVPIRVLRNGTGSEVVFTLFQLPGMSAEKFAEDARLVESDLRTLKAVLE
jgi:hypothetical protein